MSWYSIVRRGGTTNTQWDPSQLASLLSWYDADAETLSDGASVTTLIDRADSHDMSGTATFKTGVLNGKPVYRYDGTSDEHSIGANNILDAASGFWLFMVFLTNDVSKNQTVYAYRDPNGQFPRPLLLLNPNKLYSMAHRATNEAVAVDSDSGNNLSAGSAVVAGMFCDGTNQYLRKDGSTIGSAAFAGGTLNSGQSLGTAIGYDPRANNKHLDGDVAEVVIGSANIQAADAQKIEGYLAHKWGLTANLPVGHPYKTTAPTA